MGLSRVRQEEVEEIEERIDGDLPEIMEALKAEAESR